MRRPKLERSRKMASPRSPNAVNRHIASRLRLRRLEAGITQTGLAEALGISFQQVQKYENGTNRITARALYQVSIALAVPMQYFFEGLGERAK